MSTAPPLKNASRCPLCGGDNRCAMEIERATGQAQGPCWCVAENFPPDVIAALPAEAQGKACICSQCLKTYAQRPSAQGEPT